MSYGITSRRQIYVYLESPKEEGRDKIKYWRYIGQKLFKSGENYKPTGSMIATNHSHKKNKEKYTKTHNNQITENKG